MDFFSKDKRTALEAMETAQWIAFGPAIFQAARILRDSGILQAVEDSAENGMTIEAIAEKTALPHYGVRVLLESGLGMGLVLLNDKRYTIGKTGHFILHDPLTRVNMDFVQDVCYEGLHSLDKSIETGKPVGLKSFGNWTTIYEALAHLPEQVRKSWFNFDHYFSDDAFPKVLSKVYNNGILKLLDVGGNTGKWAMASVGYKDNVEVTIMDLPGQLNVAKAEIEKRGLGKRVFFEPANILDPAVKFPKGFDAIWFSQCLDCFSDEEIVAILQRCYEALDDKGVLFILEPFWDKQRYEIAAFCLQQTSLYFAALANGNSQMYSAETFLACVDEAGFDIVEQTDNIGLSQTLLKCKKKKIGFDKLSLGKASETRQIY